MKRLVSLALVALLCVACFACIAEESSSYDFLQEMSFEELLSLNDALQEELTKKSPFTLDETSLVLLLNGKSKLTASFGTSQLDTVKDKLTWTSSDRNTVSVTNGNISAFRAGSAVITCTYTSPTGQQLTASCSVEVHVPVSNVSFRNGMALTARVGDVLKPELIIYPNNATNQEVAWSSNNENVIQIKDNQLYVVGGGNCKITVSTTDGSNKKAEASVHVPTIRAEQDNYTVTSKEGLDITLPYYGTDIQEVTVSAPGNFFSIRTDFKAADTIRLHITPNVAGNSIVTLRDPADPKTNIQIRVTIDHNAVYDKTSYPSIKYKEVFRYPDRYEGAKVSFSGYVLQVMDGKNEVTLRVSSSGRYNNVVYVTLKKDANYTNILEDDHVTIYGTCNGNYSYTTIMGGSVTIPHVLAEKLIIR